MNREGSPAVTMDRGPLLYFDFLLLKGPFQDQHEEGRTGHHESKTVTIPPMDIPDALLTTITGFFLHTLYWKTQSSITIYSFTSL